MSVAVSRSRLSALNRKQRIVLWATSTRRRYKEAWDIFSRNRLALMGVLLLVVFALMAIAHPILMGTVWQKYIYDPYTGYDLEIFSHPSLPSARHLMGTDTLGRDVFSILLAATTPTFVMAIAAAIVTAVVGTLAGAASAYFRGFVDGFLTHLADLCLLVPAPLVMVVIGFVLDITPLQFGVLYGLLSGLGGVSIIMRAYTLPIMTKPYVDAARVAGGSNLHIIFKHILPQMLPMTVVNMMLTVTGAVFASGFVAFLGLSRARLNWGSMIYDSFTFRAINSTITWNVLIPSAMAISLFSAAFYLIARGIHQVAEPRLRER